MSTIIDTGNGQLEVLGAFDNGDQLVVTRDNCEVRLDAGLHCEACEACTTWLYAVVNEDGELKTEWLETMEQAMGSDNELQSGADRNDDPDLYHDNCQLTWQC